MKVIIDEYHLAAHEECFNVSDDNSFIEARKLILDYKLGNEKNKTIAIIKHPYSSWFFDIENESSIVIENLLPSKILKQNHKSIDEDLTEMDIIFLNLLNDPVEPTESALINKFFGSFLFKSTNLKQILYDTTSYVVNLPKQFTLSVYLQKKWIKYLDKVESETPTIHRMLSKLKDADSDFCKVLNLLLYVSNSPFLLREFIHDNRAYLEKSLNGSIKDLEKLLVSSKLEVQPNELFEASIEKKYKDLYKANLKNFFSEVGGYKTSLRVFLTLTKSLSNDQKEFIYKNYEKCIDHEIEGIVKSLIKPNLIAPPLIEGISLSNQMQSWQTWAVECFIPYKFYLDEAKLEEEYGKIEEYANSYADWLFKSYASIIQNGTRTNYNITNIINDSLDDFKVIWLIVDGFPAVYTNLLETVLRSNGINKINTDFHFTALPTVTAIGIPTQLCGKTPQSESFTLNRAEALNNSFKGKKVIFRNSVANFQEVLESEYDVCCLHWTDIDRFMHEDDNQVEGKRIDEVKRLLEIRIKQISNVIKSNSDKRMKLFISTDHGCTKCLIKGRTINNTALLLASKDNAKERCIELNDIILKTQIDEDEVYYLKSEESLNSRNWAIARGYRYFGRFDYGYRHGGLTPEETIVPMLSCEVMQDEILSIRVSNAGLSEIQLGFTETLRLTIQNDNDALIQIHNISIEQDYNATMNLREQIEPLSFIVYEGKIKLPKSTNVTDGKAQVKVTVSYSLFGTKFTKSFIISILIKKSVNESLDNLFT